MPRASGLKDKRRSEQINATNQASLKSLLVKGAALGSGLLLLDRERNTRGFFPSCFVSRWSECAVVIYIVGLCLVCCTAARFNSNSHTRTLIYIYTHICVWRGASHLPARWFVRVNRKVQPVSHIYRTNMAIHSQIPPICAARLRLFLSPSTSILFLTLSLPISTYREKSMECMFVQLHTHTHTYTGWILLRSGLGSPRTTQPKQTRERKRLAGGIMSDTGR